MQTLYVLAQPGFVIPWYLFGIGVAAWIAYDTAHANTPLPAALKWAWPILAVFFSIPGLLLYLTTSRPSSIGQLSPEDRRQRFRQYAQPTFRKVVGSVNHCVGGDGLGIVTAMVLARLWSFSFWQEFWFEYAAGYLFGWLIFQYKAMLSMAPSARQALWMACRAEFFSMMTVMAGMGLVMGVVTPLVVGQQPPASTYSFWGFAALGLAVGWLTTLPMNYWLVKIGWKHGMSTSRAGG